MEPRLPAKARAYITLVVVLAITLGAIAVVRHPIAPGLWYGMPVLAALGFLAGRNSINIVSDRLPTGTASISVGFFAVLVVLLKFGLVPGLLTALASALAQMGRNLTRYQVLFNCAALVLVAWLTYQVLAVGFALGLTPELFVRNDIVALQRIAALFGVVVVASLFYHAINALLISLAISLAMGWSAERTKTFFRENTLWIAPLYCIAACAVFLAAWVIRNVEAEPLHFGPLGVLITPLPVLFFYNLKLHRERDQEREKRFKELESLYTSMVTAMGRAIEAKDRYTQEHIERVVSISMGIGRQMGLTPSALRSLEVGAALHDIGKIAIPEEILNKPGKLTPEEFLLVQEHAALGSEILQPVPFPPEVVHAVRHHHEKWDGTGYPDRLAGEDIPLVARIVAVADVYDALTSDRPYRAAWSHERALAFLRDQVGRHFDSEVFFAFERAMLKEPHLQAKLHDPLVGESASADSVPLRLAA